MKRKIVLSAVFVVVIILLYMVYGALNPIDYTNPMYTFDVEPGNYAYEYITRAIENEDETDAEIIIDELPSTNSKDYVSVGYQLYAEIRGIIPLKTTVDIILDKDIYKDRMVAKPKTRDVSHTFSGGWGQAGSNIILYVGGLNEKEKEDLLGSICLSIKYSNALIGEQELVISAEDYGYTWADTGTLGNIGVNRNTIGDEEVIIAVVDTGIDGSCYPLRERMSDGWDYYNGDDSTYDKYVYDYHGTYVATTIASVVPNVKIMPLKFMEGTSGSVDDAVSAIEYAIEKGADIINCSWQTAEDNDNLEKIISDNPDVLFVCAAGNTNINLDEQCVYPCSYDYNNIISVIASDASGIIYDASGYGIINCDVAAPGIQERVILPENDVDNVDGTSVATAFVTAEAAAVLSKDSSLTPGKIKEIICCNVSEYENLHDKCASGGFINVEAALDSVK
ncbi:MAG: S8 family serine peptidase [Eubacterium sp.]|nr:S8 family serine peptidase [Eubacterium sp.]